eukprot:jgi/Tetstr1/428331/TSEL_018366.t1
MAMMISTVVEGAHDGKILCCAFNAARNEIFTGGEDHLVKVWNARSGDLVNTVKGHKGWVTCLVYIPELKYLVSGSVDGTIVVRTDTCLEVQVVEFSGGVFCMDYSPRDSQLIVGGNATFAIYKASPVNMRQLIRYHNHQRMLKSDKTRQRNALIDDAAEIAFKALDTGSQGMVQLRGAESGHTDVIKAILCLSNGRFLTAGFDQRIIMRDADRLRETKPFQKCHTAAVTQLCLDHLSNYIISCSYDGTVCTWNMEGRCLDKFTILNDKQTSACYVGSLRQYWVRGREKVLAYDPRSPANVSKYIQDVSDLDEYDIAHLHSTPDSDVVVGLTRLNQIVVWRYHLMAPYRTIMGERMLDPSSGWIEHLIVVTLSTGAGREHIFTASNDGKVTHWRLDQEQHTDAYVHDARPSRPRYSALKHPSAMFNLRTWLGLKEEFVGHEGGAMCLCWVPDFEAVVSGGEDATIRIWYLDRRERTFSDGAPIPTVMTGHDEKITSLVLLPDNVLVSVSYDQSIRKWDLENMAAMESVPNAHDHGLTCVDYCPEHHLLATTGGESAVKVWDADELTLAMVLEGHKHEATQVCWAAFKGCWVTCGDDDTIRLWDKDGMQLNVFDYVGDSGLRMHIDNPKERMLLACMDRTVRVYDLKDRHPILKFQGHTDAVRCIGCLQEFGWYVSGSWDKTLRLWLGEKHMPKPGKRSALPTAQAPNAAAPQMKDDETDHEKYKSSYEKLHPLTAPKTLKLGGGGAMMRSMGLTGKKGKKGAGRESPIDPLAEDETPVSRTGLGAKLNELENRLNPPENDDEHEEEDYYY